MKGITWINLLLGIYLIVAAIARSATGVVMTNDVILGILLLACSWWMLAAMAPPLGLAWFEMLCGVWLIVAPFVLGYSAMTHAATGNDVVVGIVTIIVAAITARALTQTPTAAA